MRATLDARGHGLATGPVGTVAVGASAVVTLAFQSFAALVFAPFACHGKRAPGRSSRADNKDLVLVPRQVEPLLRPLKPSSIHQVVSTWEPPFDYPSGSAVLLPSPRWMESSLDPFLPKAGDVPLILFHVSRRYSSSSRLCASRVFTSLLTSCARSRLATSNASGVSTTIRFFTPTSATVFCACT